jgi:hypothetical protein
VLSKAYTLRVLDNLISALQDYRAEIEDGQVESLRDHLNQAYADRLSWWAQRQRGDWQSEELSSQPELPTSSQMLSRLWGGGRKSKK